MSNDFAENIGGTLEGFTDWLEQYGETSYDHQSYYAGKIGGAAKRLYYNNPMIGIFAVSPMVLSEALLPFGRKLFHKKQRLPIADAHYAMGFAFMYKIFKNEKFLQKAKHFLEVLIETRCKNYTNMGWGYPFDWETKLGQIPMGTPLITTTPYVYEAFLQVYELEPIKKWRTILRSIAEHVYNDYKDFRFNDDSYASAYTPLDSEAGVINASAYRAFVLTSAAKIFSEEKYKKKAQHNINFVVKTQKDNGSWPYHAEDVRDFVDHFHTCFVLKALAKINLIDSNIACKNAIDKGISYYLQNLFDDDGLPKPFSRRPRLTVYKNELYDYAECINLGTLLYKQDKKLDETCQHVIIDIIERWKKKDGSFKSRKLFLGWDNVPMHRWAQSQLFRSLAFYLNTIKKTQ